MRARSSLYIAFVSLLLAAGPAQSQKFYPDDPLEKEPDLWPTVAPEARALSDILEVVSHIFGSPGEHHPEFGIIPAGGVNTLGEVLDGPWFVNRHAKKRLTEDALRRGPGDGNPPSTDGPWKVLTVKPFGVRPGILIADSRYDLYLLRFDPEGSPELATGAEVVSSRIFHALGYHVPENYIVYFDRDDLVIEEGAEGISSMGNARDLVEADIDAFLMDVAFDAGKGYRAVATRAPGSWAGLLGPFQAYGTRSDDPNDIVSHEHRRDLRGLFVFASWVNHTSMRAVNSLDALVQPEDTPFIRHYLIDFFSTLGSDGYEPKDAWVGNERRFDVGQTFKNIAGMGIYTPRWMRASYPGIRAVGRFDYETFEPERWKPTASMAPFDNRLPDDTYWAAKQVLAFTDDDIRAIVSTGQYSNPEAEDWIARCLIERRDRIGAVYLSKVLPLDDFSVEGHELAFRDLAVEYGYVRERTYSVSWFTFDNDSERQTPIGTPASSFEVPPMALTAADGEYFAAQIVAGEPDKTVRVYVRKESDALRVVGLERSWPGKVLVDAREDVDTGRSRYTDLVPVQRTLFQGYAQDYNERTGFDLSPRDYFDSLTISERTTYDAVTHALMNSELTDEAGTSLGTAIELVAGIERIAGQYYGRSGDQQFRLYVDLHPGAKETLERSVEFFLGHENTVYHVGYPYSYRQDGNVPNIQFSVSEDGMKADIDVDYRSSKMPQAMWNGHLTSANSDVRAGDNYRQHSRRWAGFVDWWRELFGQLEHAEEEAGPDLLSRERPEPPTPLPPNRPRGARIEKLHDAAQEFLTDWLVRGEVAEAAVMISDRALACIDTDDDARDEVLEAGAARTLLQEIMEGTVDRLGDRDNLTEAIDVVLPWDPKNRVVSQPFENDFALLEITNATAAPYLCGREVTGKEPEEYGTYFAVIFRFKLQGSGVLGLLWSRENGDWKIVSYEVFEQ